MLVSHTHRLIFLKTIKTGGSSIEIALENLLFPGAPRPAAGKPFESEEGIIGARGSSVSGEKYWNHMPAVEVYRALGYVRFNDYRKMTVIRNPFDKVVSWFFFGFHKQSNFVDDRESFNSFIQSKRRFPIDRAIYAIGEQICCSIVVKYENLEADFNKAISTIGLNSTDNDVLPKEKTGSRAERIPYQEYYNEESKRLVEEAFGFELRNFDYEF